MDKSDPARLTKDLSSLVMGVSSQGLEVRGRLTRVTPHAITFEVCTPLAVLRSAEVLTDFKIVLDQRLVYSGKAVISGLVNAGSPLICEASLQDEWLEEDLFTLTSRKDQLRSSYQAFLHQWHRAYRILPEFKLLVADMQAFLTELRLWLDQVEMGVRATASDGQSQLERDSVGELGQSLVPSLNLLFEKFERVADAVPADLAPAHHRFLKQQLHPLVLCAPFAWRTFTKPLGYAGDYEMVNMILRDPQEGSSLYAKLLNVWFISQPPAEAHRNRIELLTSRLIEETVRVSAEQRPIRIFNLGCGPASEVERFLAAGPLANHAQFALLDFNQETLDYAARVLQQSKQRHQRRTGLRFVKKSVTQLLRSAARGGQNGQQYDYLYCAGLFDYLPDWVCKQLMAIFYDMLAPGGLVVATNVDKCNPIRHMLDYVLEWHLIYRNARQLRALVPAAARAEDARVSADPTGINLCLEVRRPAA